VRRRGEGVSGIGSGDTDAAGVSKGGLELGGVGEEDGKHHDCFDPHDNFKQNALL